MLTRHLELMEQISLWNYFMYYTTLNCFAKLLLLFCWRPSVLFVGHWYTCFGPLVMSTLGSKDRVGSLTCLTHHPLCNFLSAWDKTGAPPTEICRLGYHCYSLLFNNTLFLYLKIPHVAIFTSAREPGTSYGQRADKTLFVFITILYLQPNTERGTLWSTRVGYRQTRNQWDTQRHPLVMWFVNCYGSVAYLQYVKS